MKNIGYRLRVPPRCRKSEWQELRSLVEEMELLMADTRKHEREKRKGELRREIALLKSRPATRGRIEMIMLLEQEQMDLISKG